MNRLRDAFNGKYCIPVVGAGASIAAGAPSWREFLAQMAEGLDINFEDLMDGQSDFTEIASFLSSERKAHYLPEIKIKEQQIGAIHIALAKLSCPLYITTNFDTRLERAIIQVHSDVFKLGYDQLHELNLRELPSKPTVVKICSSSHDIGTGVMTVEDFSKLVYNEKAALELLITLMRTNLLLFVGSSLRDPLLKTALLIAKSTNLGYVRPVAILQDKLTKPQEYLLAEKNIDLVKLPSIEFQGELVRYLNSYTKTKRGEKNILVFEPGLESKLNQVIAAVRKIDTISQLGIITGEKQIVDQIEIFKNDETISCEIKIFLVSNIEDTDEIIRTINDSSVIWNSFMAPFELSLIAASNFIEKFRDPIATQIFHSNETVKISRNKVLFRNFIQTQFDDKIQISPIKLNTINIKTDSDPISIYDQIVHELKFTEGLFVIKPIDAYCSLGVRKIDVGNKQECINSIEELIKVIKRLPFDRNTSNCKIDEFIIEEFIEGEEFSVESRSSGRLNVETIAIHWKIDIEAHKDRFFERLFVTLPYSTKIYSLLSNTNTQILKKYPRINSGVFHAEYRVNIEKDRVYPIEIGLRPGGGMVSYSVNTSVGIDLFESAMQCALNIPQIPLPDNRRIVGTGLIFAEKPGILKSLRLRSFQSINLAPNELSDQDWQYTLRKGDALSLIEYLNSILPLVPRKILKEAYLSNILNANNEIRQKVLDSFDENGTGLQATIKTAEIWINPGENILDEESTYVGGILAIVDESLTDFSATAEAICAIEFCLKAIECRTDNSFSLEWQENRFSIPEWWRNFQPSHFRDDVDSWIFSKGIEFAVNQCYGGSIIDLGCGSGRPAIPFIKNGIKYFGIDIDKEAVEICNSNFNKASIDSFDIIHDDILSNNWRSKVSQNIDIIAANLPYLPCNDDFLPLEVNGGSEGLKYIPNKVLDIAENFQAKMIVLNFSSLTNTETLAKLITSRGYLICNVISILAPLGTHSKSIEKYLKSQKFSKFYGKDQNHQIIYSVVLNKLKGIPAYKVFREINEKISLVTPSQDYAIIGIKH